MNTFNKITHSFKTAYYNKQFIKQHWNRFLTCTDNKKYNRYNGQVINTINPLNIKIKLNYQKLKFQSCKSVECLLFTE